ncbi:MAG: polyphosphate kinase [Dasania sp.]|jgi:polyphosphate kinase
MSQSDDFVNKKQIKNTQNTAIAIQNNTDYTLPVNRYFNREISWLNFNTRVLEEAENSAHPLLERLRFLSISASNLDEFFSVRVAGLIALVQDDIQKIAMTGENPMQQLESIYSVTSTLMARQQVSVKKIMTELSLHGITLLTRHDITAKQEAYLETVFFDKLFPILTPIAIDPVHPFPFIPHEGLSLIVSLQQHDKQDDLQIVVPIPATLDRFHRIPCSEKKHTHFITVEDIILINLKRLFPNYTEIGNGVFSILRDTDLEVEEEAEDLVREFESALRRRKRGQIIRMKMTSSTPQNLIDIIYDKLDIACSKITFVDGLIGIASLSQMIVKERTDLLFPRYTPRLPEKLRDHDGNIFQMIAHKDFIVHHPFESFNTVVDFIRQAANDDSVVAIKSTLYRTSAKSPIIDALIEASENGKSVTAIVELKARFDEAANIRQAKALERAGVHVVYGLAGWKIHAKILLVVRQEGKKFKTYTHFGTGNYHPVTAKIYTDLSLFTSNDALGRDACRLFNFITGYIEPRTMELLAIAPLTLRATLISHIEQEITNAQNGLPAIIYAKMNSLVDGDMINALYKASQAGVKIMLNIRGVCCLKAGIKGLSDTITVISIVGRFLEHSRIVCFGNGHKFGSLENKVYISSADWMPRNLDRRVELLVPILNNAVKKTIITDIFPALFKDNTQSWQLMPNGHYERLNTKTRNQDPFCAHQFFMKPPKHL